MPCYAPNKISYTEQEVAFMKLYYGKIPNTDILRQLNTMRNEPLKMSSLRHKLRYLKLIKGVRLIHWNDAQIQYLLDNYKIKGNIQLAKELNKMKLTKRKFVKKHIEKKMVLMDLRRTEAELLAIKEGHKAAGHYPGRVHAKPENTVHIRVMAGIPHPHIKIGKFFTKQAREVWKENFGPIPEGHMVHFKDLDTMNLSPKNLELIKVGDLTFKEKQKMLSIAKINIDKINRPVKTEEVINRPSLAMPGQTIKVVINSRLTLFVKPGTDIEKLKQKYAPKPLIAVKDNPSAPQYQF